MDYVDYIAVGIRTRFFSFPAYLSRPNSTPLLTGGKDSSGCFEAFVRVQTCKPSRYGTAHSSSQLANVDEGTAQSADAHLQDGSTMLSDADEPTGVPVSLPEYYKKSDILPWPSTRFEEVKKLQDAMRNRGVVILMWDTLEKRNVAVKRMPTSWIRSSHAEFVERYPEESELPWQDIGCVKYLNSTCFPYAFDLLGVFQDDVNTMVVTSFASEGDLFSWCSSPQSQRIPIGFDRETFVRPLIVHMLQSVHQIHERSIVHRDISMENMLLSQTEDGWLHLQLIDFGMASTCRYFENCVRGKASYQAPEIHDSGLVDCFLSDTFSLGVTIYAICMQDYPWMSTKPGGCKCFEYVRKSGFRAYVKKRKLRNSRGYVSDNISEDLLHLLEGMLETDPAKRLSLGESAWLAETGKPPRRSVWDEAWLQGIDFARHKDKKYLFRFANA